MAVFNFDYFKAKLRLAIDAINEEYSDNIIAATQGIINSNYRLAFDRKYGRWVIRLDHIILRLPLMSFSLPSFVWFNEK